jgi:hypothetical protein
MKNLIKTSFLSAFLLIAFVSQAQVECGIKGGLNVSSLSGYKKDEAKYKSGFHAGLVAQINFPQSDFFIQPELLCSTEGMKTKNEGKSKNSTLSYLQLPVYAGYKIDAGSGLNIIIGAGPYVGYGLNGTDKAFKTSFNKLDYGFSGMAGFQIDKVQLTAGYDFGLADIRNKDWKKAKSTSAISNRNIKVSFAFFF